MFPVFRETNIPMFVAFKEKNAKEVDDSSTVIDDTSTVSIKISPILVSLFSTKPYI